MKKSLSIGFFIMYSFVSAQNSTIDKKVENLLKQMTLEEKIGQLNQYTGDNTLTGPLTINPNKKEEIKQGKIGSMLNILGAEYTRQYQE